MADNTLYFGDNRNRLMTTVMIWVALFTPLCAAADDEPVYDGKTLSQWVAASYNSPGGEERNNAYEALGHFVGETKALRALKDGWRREQAVVAKDLREHPEFAVPRSTQYICAFASETGQFG